MAKNNEFHPPVGDEVWVVERDENGEACEVSGYIFIAESIGFGIVSPTLNGISIPEALLEDQVEQTREEYHGNLAVFPMADVYATQKEAHEAFNNEGTGAEQE